MPKKKILILGASGMAGHVIYNYMEHLDKYALYNLVFHQKINSKSVILDVHKTDILEEYITSVRPDIVINCIGVLIKGSNSDPANAIYINAYFPHLLAKICSGINAKLIHISTDCVFSGMKGSYSETDDKDAKDTYGKTKGLGEITDNRNLTIRTSIIGPEIKENGEGLFHWFMTQEGNVNGYTKAFWSGVTTLELARFIEYAIGADINNLINLTSSEKISKYNLLLLFKNIWNRADILITPVDGKEVDKSLISSREDVNFIVQKYEDMLQNMKIHMLKHADLYPTYFNKENK